jgi:hypothetical protein
MQFSDLEKMTKNELREMALKIAGANDPLFLAGQYRRIIAQDAGLLGLKFADKTDETKTDKSSTDETKTDEKPRPSWVKK